MKMLQTTLPSFITFSSNKYTIAPKVASHVGTHQIAVILNDGSLSVSYSFNVFVTSPAPPPTPPPVVVPPPSAPPVVPSPTATPAGGSGNSNPNEELIDGPPSDDEDADEQSDSTQQGGALSSNNQIQGNNKAQVYANKIKYYVDKKTGLKVKIVMN
jgi:hypothetical protein